MVMCADAEKTLVRSGHVILSKVISEWDYMRVEVSNYVLPHTSDTF